MTETNSRVLTAISATVAIGVILVGWAGRLIGPENIDVLGAAGVVAVALLLLSVSLAAWTNLHGGTDG